MLLLTAGLLAGCARHYRGEGIILAVRSPEVTISHRAIPGYMPAMAMAFRTSRPDKLSKLQPGSRVEFDLKVRNGHSQLTRLREQAPAPPDFEVPKPKDVVAIGQPVPDFSLTDEHNQTQRLSNLRGRLTVVEFIYTRCPLPDVCPRLSANFALLQRRFGPRIGLISITLDPEYDTPAILADYARRWSANPAVWHFLTGLPDEIRRVAGHFGLIYWAEDGAVTHTSEAALIGPDGILLAKLAGTGYTAQQLVDLVSHYLR